MNQPSVVIIFALILVVSSQMNCNLFQCGQSTSMPLNSCAYSVNNIYYLRPCNSSSICGFLEYTPSNTFCSPNTTPSGTKYPGGKCQLPSDCLSGTSCTNGVCLGALSGQNCTATSNCNPGLYCSSNGTCESQLGLSSLCTQDSDWQNSVVCDFITYGNGTCKLAYSVPAYSQVNGCTLNLNSACQSGYCTVNASNNVAICLPALASPAALPIVCMNDSQCFSASDPLTNTSIQGMCQCGFNPNGNAYCPQYNGDKETAAALSLLKNWVTSRYINSCNGESKFSMECMADYWTTKNYVYFSYYNAVSQNYPLIQNNNNCTTQTLVPSYYSAYINYLNYINNHDHDDHGFGTSLLVSAVTYFLIIS